MKTELPSGQWEFCQPSRLLLPTRSRLRNISPRLRLGRDNLLRTAKPADGIRLERHRARPRFRPPRMHRSTDPAHLWARAQLGAARSRTVCTQSLWELSFRGWHAAECRLRGDVDRSADEISPRQRRCAIPAVAGCERGGVGGRIVGILLPVGYRLGVGNGACSGNWMGLRCRGRFILRRRRECSIRRCYSVNGTTYTEVGNGSYLSADGRALNLANMLGK